MTPFFAFADLAPSAWIDLACGALLALALVLGAISGFAGEFSRVLAVCAGLATAAVVHAPVRAHLFSGESTALRVLAVCTTLVAAALAAYVVRHFTHRLVASLFAQPLDGMLGALARVFVTAALLLAAAALCRALPFPELQDELFAKSRTGRIALPLLEAAERGSLSFVSLP